MKNKFLVTVENATETSLLAVQAALGILTGKVSVEPMSPGCIWTQLSGDSPCYPYQYETACNTIVDFHEIAEDDYCCSCGKPVHLIREQK